MSQTQTRSAIDEFAESSIAGPEAGHSVPAVVDANMLAVLSRAEIDAQTDKAEHKPRSLDYFRRTVREIALLNEEAADECIYALPGRQKPDGTKSEPIEGPSIRFAEILQYAWGHCRVGTRILDEGMAHVTAQGIFSDLQANVVTTAEYRRRITTAKGRRYSQDMINMTANAAASIARRNAILQGIPRPLWWDLYRECRAVAAGANDLAKLNERRAAAITYAEQKLKVAEDRVLAALGVDRREQIGIDELALLRGTFTAIRDGESSVEDAFPKLGDASKGGDAPVSASSKLDEFVAGSSSPDAEGGSNAPSPSTASEPVTAGEGRPTASPAQVTTTIGKPETIERILGLATDKKLELDDRLAELENLRPAYDDLLDVGFLDTLFSTAGKVARGELKLDAARKYLAAL